MHFFPSIFSWICAGYSHLTWCTAQLTNFKLWCVWQDQILWCLMATIPTILTILAFLPTLVLKFRSGAELWTRITGLANSKYQFWATKPTLLICLRTLNLCRMILMVLLAFCWHQIDFLGLLIIFYLPYEGDNAIFLRITPHCLFVIRPPIQGYSG